MEFEQCQYREFPQASANGSEDADLRRRRQKRKVGLGSHHTYRLGSGTAMSVLRQGSRLQASRAAEERHRRAGKLESSHYHERRFQTRHERGQQTGCGD